MKRYTTDALVLKSLNYRDSDRIYTLLTKDFGKISAVARGVRKLSSRRSGNLDSLNYVSVKITESSRGFKNIDEVKTLKSHGGVKEDYSSLVSAYYIAELTHRSIEEDSPVPAIYELFLESLQRLEDEKYDPTVVVSRFEVLLLKLLGYDIDETKNTSILRSIGKLDVISRLKSSDWAALADTDVHPLEVVIKSYIYSYLTDHLKSLEMA